MKNKIGIVIVAIMLCVCEMMFSIPGECKNYTGEYDKPYKEGTIWKVAKDEVLKTSDDMASVYRSSFGLIAKNVKDCYTNAASVDICFTQFSKPNRLLEVDFLRRKKNGNGVNYVCYKVTDNAKKVYLTSSINMFFQNRKGKICYTGVAPCNLLFAHKTEKECKKHDEKNVRNKVVLSGVKKCWSGSYMFAYIKNNALYITGYATNFRSDTAVECCQRKSCYKKFFIGKGNQIKQVVTEQTANGSVILALMKDGSVWGIGDNTKHLLTDTDEKFYEEDFVQIVESGVKEIGIAEKNIGILKKDNTLWIWGRGYNKGKKQYSREPKKVASNVKRFSMSEENVYFINQKDTAYGMGSNECYQLSNQYNKKWKSKPVKLMKKVKQVYGVVNNGYNTCILTKKNELYWVGEQTGPSLYWW